MAHIQIAYDLFVIIIGFAALSNAGFWALKTREAYLRDFCILYSLFTGVLVCSVLIKYLSLNVENFPLQSIFIITGIAQLMSFAVIVATIYFFVGIYRVKSRKTITTIFLTTMFISVILLLSPPGATLDAEHKIILLGTGYQIAFAWYFVSFTFMLGLGYGLLKPIWKTNKKTFIIGLLLFASVGYIETIIDIFTSFHNVLVVPINHSGYQFSSIPYALYGIFLIYYFLSNYAPAPGEMVVLSESFLNKYGITERESEIILKVIQGKSNSEIGEELFISLATVKTHLHNIYRKIGIDSRFDLLARVRAHHNN